MMATNVKTHFLARMTTDNGAPHEGTVYAANRTEAEDLARSWALLIAADEPIASLTLRLGDKEWRVVPPRSP